MLFCCGYKYEMSDTKRDKDINRDLLKCGWNKKSLKRLNIKVILKVIISFTL